MSISSPGFPGGLLSDPEGYADYKRRRAIQDDQEAKIAAERAEYRKKQLGQGDFGGNKDTLG